MVRIQPNRIENSQQITAVVAGPDGANRLFILDGQFGFSGMTTFANTKETYSVLLGPVLTHRQFVQAIGTASVAAFSLAGGVAAGNSSWSVNSVDADWDDESGQVELRVEVSGLAVQTNKLAYHVTILAEI